MAFDPELLADFLNEAQDLMDLAQGDITALESAPEDPDRINGLFRAFHTVKGGAGFIGITPLVDLCHKAEDLLSEIRAGKLRLTATRIDVIARALSQTEAMLAMLAQDEEPIAAPAELFEAIHHARTDDAAPADSDEISDDEFEALLDELHGSGGAPGKAADGDGAPAAEAEARGGAPEASAAPAADTDAPAAATETSPAPGGGSGAGQTPAPGSAGKDAAAKAPKREAEAPVRVDAKRLDKMMDLVGELVLVRNRLKAQPEGLDESARRAVAELDHVTSSLQRSVMAVRMQPVGRLFSRIPRMVRELARSLGKDVEVILEGESAELDKHMLDALGDPLVHLVRNALDHGIETPAERTEAGKPERGRLRVAARQAGDHIEILLEDDGKGIDADAVRAIAVKRGVLDADAAARLDEESAQALIFAPGFSTREAISDVSGRGVGMDVVKSRLVELGGSVTLASTHGKGTQIKLRLPLTLAVLPSLMVRAADRVFALPLAEVRELSALALDQVEKVGRRWQVPMGKGVLPLRFLRGWMAGHDRAEPGLIVQVMLDDRPWGLVVDGVAGREDIVVRPLARKLRAIPGYGGATVTGRGEVALVLDPQSLIRAGNGAGPTLAQEEAA